MKKYGEILFACCLVGLLCTAGASFAAPAPESTTTIDAVVHVAEKHFIDGVSRLERNAYFNLHGGADLPPERPQASREELAQILMEELDISFGRHGVGGDKSIRTDVPEDPNRPGYVDPNWEALQPGSNHSLVTNRAHPLLMRNYGHRIDLALTGGGIPHFMLREGITEADSVGQRLAAIENPDAYGDYLARLVRARLDNGWQASFFELFNEPPGHWLTDWNHLADLHAATARHFRELVPEVGVGGACYYDPFLFREDFARWEQQHKLFIDRAGADLDYLSFHFYDFHPADLDQVGFRSDGFYSTGGRREAELDLLENYTFDTHQRVLPIFTTEYGGYHRPFSDVTIAGEDDPDNEELRNWYMVNSVNRMLMTFLQRPTTVVKAVPFILGYTGWNPVYHAAMIRTDGEGYRFTTMSHFYRFWSGVTGDRILSRASDHNLAMLTLVDGDTVYISLDNFYYDPVEVNLDVLLDTGTTVVSATSRRLYMDADTHHVTLTEDQPLPELSFRMYGHEKKLITLQLNRAPQWQRAINETRHYGDETVVPIAATPQQFTIEAPVDEAVPAYATLRLGIGRAHGLSLSPTVTINGHQLQVPSYHWGGNQEGFPAYWAVREMDVPVAVLEATNRVEVEFPDQGGHISTVILTVGWELEETETGPFLEAHYRQHLLPQPFATIEPETGSVVDALDTVFRWQAATNAEQYQLLVATDPDFRQLVVDQQTQATEIRLTHLHHGQTYYWTVMAQSKDHAPEMASQRFNTEGVMEFSTAAAPSAPRAPEQFSGASGFDAVLLQWEPVPNADTYMVQRRLADTTDYETIAQDLPRWETEYTDSSGTAGNRYGYRVVAANHRGAGAPSEEILIAIAEVTNRIELDFSQGFTEEWTRSGNWSIRDSVANMRGLFPRVFGNISYPQPIPVPYRLEYSIRPREWGNPEMAVLRLSVNMSGGDRYQIIYWHNQRRLELVRRTQAGGVMLAEANLAMALDNWYDFRLELMGGQLQLSVNEELLLQAVDPQPLQPGTLELYITNMDLDLNRIVITH